MSEKSFKKIGSGVVKRTQKRVMGVFIDGTSLDRATRRLNKKIDLRGLIRGVSSGVPPQVIRYYTLIPHEDDSRQRAFLDAVRSAGLQVVVKRLPPKGITRQVTVDITMAADMVAFGLGVDSFDNIGFEYVGEESDSKEENNDSSQPSSEDTPVENAKRIVTAVCPSRDLSYAFSLLSSFSIETVTVDFGEAAGKELLKAASKWIDLSTSETIWRPEA